jgi:hypothetical protein
VAVDEADGCEVEDDIEGVGDEGRCGCGGTDSEVEGCRCEGAEGLGSDGS